MLDAQVKHKLHRDRDAKNALNRIFAIAHKYNSRLFQFNAHIIEAQFAFDRGKPEAGLQALRQGLSIGRHYKYMRTFIDNPRDTANLCVKALEAEIEVDYVRDIVRRRQLIPEIPPVHLDAWPWPLKIYTLGRFAIVRQGDNNPLQPNGKAQAKPLAMLKVLIAYGGREVREAQISDALWPEADGDLAHKSFATTLWRLRKLIGYPEAIILNDGKLALDPRYCWVDVWALERMLKQTDIAWGQGVEKNDMAEAIFLVEKANDFYQGPFLAADGESDWVIAMRDGLQSKLLHTLKRLASYWNESGQHEKTVQWYQRCLQVDELDETVCQSLMTCYAGAGYIAAALELYERHKRILLSRLRVKPSERLKDLRDALLSN